MNKVLTLKNLEDTLFSLSRKAIVFSKFDYTGLVYFNSRHCAQHLVWRHLFISVVLKINFCFFTIVTTQLFRCFRTLRCSLLLTSLLVATNPVKLASLLDLEKRLLTRGSKFTHWVFSCPRCRPRVSWIWGFLFCSPHRWFYFFKDFYLYKATYSWLLFQFFFLASVTLGFLLI